MKFLKKFKCEAKNARPMKKETKENNPKSNNFLRNERLRLKKVKQGMPKFYRKLDQSKSVINSPSSKLCKLARTISQWWGNQVIGRIENTLVGYLTKLDFVKQLIIKLELKTEIIE